ncbi:MAG TPA: DUF6356 family protein, partial [Acidobacteriota bacterium]|nr:DUF6356 family protein [Acidobacteriota bacterium]
DPCLGPAVTHVGDVMTPLRPYLNHMALNLGFALSLISRFLEALFHAFIPPQWTGHTAEECRSLAEGTMREAFREGLGRKRKPPKRWGESA